MELPLFLVMGTRSLTCSAAVGDDAAGVRHFCLKIESVTPGELEMFPELPKKLRDDDCQSPALGVERPFVDSLKGY